MSQDVIVIVEHLNGVIADVTYEMLARGRQVASATGGSLHAVIVGSDATGTLAEADKVIVINGAGLEHFNPEPHLAALTDLLKADTPRLVLVGNTSMGMDLAAALSIRLDLPLVAYASDVAVADGSIVVTSQLYGGKIYAESVLESAGIVSLLAGSIAAGPKDGSPEVETRDAPVTESRIRFQELIQPEAGDVDITRHDVLVAVGRGIQEEDNLPLVEELAKALGGAVCASRPIVDNKWLPKARQVGKSGTKVKPKVYLALGISGAPEHIEGMKDAELIIAVNTDETAPIFDYAHYGTTEDLLDVVPALTKKLSE